MDLEIDIECNLRVKINQKDDTSSIIDSPKATGNVIVPRFAKYKNKKFKIISVEGYAFSNCHIDSLIFPENSEIETFENSCFNWAHIKKIKFPPSLKKLNENWANSLRDLTEIEVSPNNPFFIYYDNKYLLGKSDESSDKFDILYYARFDIEEARIPRQVTIIKPYSFGSNKKLKSVTFPENSMLKSIGDYSFSGSTLEKLAIPASLEKIGESSFISVQYLKEIKVSPKNKVFKILNDKCLLTMGDPKSGIFDTLLFGRRDIESVLIPSYIKVIKASAFDYCTNLKTIFFESGSSLEEIEYAGFSSIQGLEKITIPPSVRKIGSNSFSTIKDVTCIEILSKSLTIGSSAFAFSKKLTAVTFPNADHIKFESYSMTGTPNEMKIMVKKEAKLEGEGLDECVSKISYIEKETAPPNKRHKERRNSDDNDHLSELENENSNLKKYVSYLKSHLRKYEKVISFDDFLNESDEYDTEDEIEPERHPFVGPDDEEFHQVVSKIGEGGTSDVYKIIDERTGEVICKKVMKECHEEAAFKTLKNSLKELEVGMNIRHPCICEAIGYNTHEKLLEVGPKNQQKKTTIALFFELLPFSVEDVIKKGLMSNTLKVRIAVEVAFGMSYLHSLGMIHRDLKLGNIMMNSVFDSKIIDFGLVHISDISMTDDSMTKGIGTLAYMSPEMVNEEDYDNKTDVYSYGIVLFKLFAERLPKQSMRDRMNNVPMEYPTESDKISKYCIRLIRRCTKFEAERRPTFDDIIDDLFSHNFGLAPEVDVKVIIQRFRELNIIRKQNNKRKRSKKK